MKEIRCPECNSEDTYFSKKKQKYVCEDCECEFVDEASLRPKNVFFSYAHDDNEWLVRKIKQDVEKHGHSVWIDRNEIKSGDDWRESITSGLLSSNGVVSFLSRHSVRVPGVCLDELRIALSSRNGNIKTVLLEGEKDVSPPSSISDIQWLDLSDWKREFENKLTWEAWYQSKIQQLCAILDKDEFASFSGDVDSLQGLLKVSTTDSKEQQLISKTFIGRKWLSDAVEEWRSNKYASSVFLLLGAPGIGKSCFAANQLHYNPNVICGVFCEWDKESQKDAKNIIKTIAFKLATKLPDYRKILLTKFECRGTDFIQALGAADLFEQILIQPLSELIDGGRDKKIIVIDGLDEAGSNDDNELAVLLAKFSHRLPHWIGLLITSRPESIIKQTFSAYNPYEYSPMSDFNTSDISEYIELNLSNEEGFNKDTVLPTILTKCEGNFLFASMFIEGVKNRTIDLRNIALYPEGLDAIYTQNFTRLFVGELEYSLPRKILEIILASDKMPLEMICDILNISKYEFLSFKTKLGSILVEIKAAYSEKNYYTYFSFCHKSIIDWLSDYDKSGRFYVDVISGYKSILEYFIEKIKKQIPTGECESMEEYTDSYIRNHIIAYFVKTKNWDKLSKFLLETDTPLFPYWRCLTMFPKTYDISILLNSLWKNPERDEYFNLLQRFGESSYILEILGQFKEKFGINQFSDDLFETYVDIVHLNGGYQDSVKIYDDYLSLYKEEEIYKNRTLMHYSIRRLHHSMFFAPVQKLIERALILLEHIREEEAPKDYNELLFLIGGNLGLLSGNFEFAGNWLDKCEDFADKICNRDFQSRAARKRADLLTVNGELDSALTLISRYINLESIPKTRYEIYLLGSLGEVYRCLKDYKNAKKAFDLLLTMANDRGIIGWVAHANLALANLYCDSSCDNHAFENSLEYLNKAKALYEKIQQAWGIINSAIVEFKIVSRFSSVNEDLISKMRDVKRKADDVQYKYEAQIIDKLLSGMTCDHQLLFL